jgi:DNA-binding response OmpR family regulator
MARILIVEDEPDIAMALRDDMQSEGYDATVVGDGPTAAARGRETGWDLILLDVMLPGKDGFDVCRELRRHGVTTPIVVLTAKAQEAEKVMGLELGADDYVTKPFSPRELRARVKAILRRTATPGGQIYAFDTVEVDFARAEVRRDGTTLEMTPIEFKLLETFIRRRGRVLTREQLLDAAWSRGVHVTDRAVDAHIVNLRRKIEPDPATPRLLVSVRGLGYRFDG